MNWTSCLILADRDAEALSSTVNSALPGNQRDPTGHVV
ncbi:hypothetical protein HU200_005100 [Digitaria exilis]|uniref:Uncharacterized protein n=1 Tax=Digitaria exilis TaxID=1010633 RepID=A0A835AHM9_9POAL|nr:hypothetical protein HU200_056089 [Digitaria exilis]KAF8775049.1 hypothetical protein HU200_005100 [Digitaria exilis]